MHQKKFQIKDTNAKKDIVATSHDLTLEVKKGELMEFHDRKIPFKLK